MASMLSTGSDRIRVAVRLRPYNKREIELGCSETVSIHANQIVVKSPDS
jgi:hypothetical protein